MGIRVDIEWVDIERPGRGHHSKYKPMTDEEFRALWAEIGEGAIDDVREYLRLGEGYNPDDESPEQEELQARRGLLRRKIAQKMLDHFKEEREAFLAMTLDGTEDLIDHLEKNNLL